MARGDFDRLVTQGLIDRLIDREPSLEQDPAITRAQSIRNLRAEVRRDLEFLLNTRRNPEAAGPELKQLSQSVFNYGLPDFTHRSMQSNVDRDQLQEEIERVIALFEPRLKQVRVKLIEEEGQRLRQALRFSIEALLMMDPAPERISFDTVLESSGQYEIRGDRSA
jgi:type VI secretion system protein ImpF